MLQDVVVGPRPAMIVAVSVAVTVLVVQVKVAVDAPVGTVTVAGTVASALLLLSITVVGAATGPGMLTVPVCGPRPPRTLVCRTWTFCRIGARTVRWQVLVTPATALRTPSVLVVTGLVLTDAVAVVDPCGTVTVAAPKPAAAVPRGSGAGGAAAPGGGREGGGGGGG